MKTTEQSTERVIYNSITPGIQNADANVKYYKTLITAALKEWSAVADTPLTLMELAKLVNNQYSQAQMVADLLTSRLLSGKSFNMDGIKISASKLANIIEIPECVDFLQALNLFKKASPSNISIYRVEGVQWQVYSLSNGKVLVDEVLLEQYKDNQFRSFAETPEQKRRLAIIQPVCTALNTMAAANEPGININWLEFVNVIELNPDDKFVPHPFFINTGSQIDAHAAYNKPVEAKETKPNFAGIKDVLN